MLDFYQVIQSLITIGSMFQALQSLFYNWMSQINPRRDWSEGIHTLNQKELLIDQRLVVQPRRPVLCTLQLSPLSYVTMDQWSNRRREDVHIDLQWLFWLHYTTKLCHDVNLNTDRNRSQCAAMDSFHCSNPSSIGCPISKSHRLFHPLIHPLHFHPFVRCPPGLLNTPSHPNRYKSQVYAIPGDFWGW